VSGDGDKLIYHVRVQPEPLEIDVSATDFAAALEANAESGLDEIASLLYWLSGDFPEDGGYTYEVYEVATGRIVETGDDTTLNKKFSA
jgi:hypothetical protein